jgi:sigma-B regulation protein RsbU (phosphoserine phosphatase)
LKTLIAWDQAEDADLLALYLGAGDHEAAVALTPEALLAQAGADAWDVVLMSLTFPTTAEEGFAWFQRLQELVPGTPVVLAFRQTEMFTLARFLAHGLRFYLVRDQGGDFVFLALSCLESAVSATRAEEARKLAERLREELDGVRKLQEAIIPHGLRPPPGYRAAARYEPAHISVVGGRPVAMAGGDYYDLFRPEEHTLITLVGDASGHGLKACMSIMAMHTLVRMLSGDRYRDTAAFVTEVNQGLCKNSIVQSDGGFITLFYAAIDTATHTMRWTSAGHPLALVHRLRGNQITAVGTEADGDLPLGVTPDVAYGAATLQLPPDSRVLLYSDGLSDAFPLDGSARQAFGVKGIMETLRACVERSLEETLEELFRASHAVTGGTGRHDDTSVVLLERAGG